MWLPSDWARRAKSRRTNRSRETGVSGSARELACDLQSELGRSFSVSLE
jgi:hypothetical protein